MKNRTPNTTHIFQIRRTTHYPGGQTLVRDLGFFSHFDTAYRQAEFYDRKYREGEYADALRVIGVVDVEHHLLAHEITTDPEAEPVW